MWQFKELEEIKSLKQVSLNVCSNLKCQKQFENLIIVCDNSKNPATSYYACPFCFFKLDPTAIQKINGPIIKAIDDVLEKPSENDVLEGCTHYFGYLIDHYNDSIISEECLLCSRMSKCILEKSTESSDNGNGV